MIRGKKNFVRNNFVQVSVGMTDEGKLVSGPEEAIGKNSLAYVVLEPHREKASDTAKKVRRELTLLLGDQQFDGPTIDEIVRLLPSGGGRVIRRKGSAAVRQGSP
jgi:hypothetical protein